MSAPARKRASSARGAYLVGRDLARVRLARHRPSRPLAALLIGALCAGLGLASLRIDILRLRYALAESLEREQELLDSQHVWTAREQSLRHPSRLAELARKRGFARPRRVIDLRALQLAKAPRP